MGNGRIENGPMIVENFRNLCAGTVCKLLKITQKCDSGHRNKS